MRLFLIFIITFLNARDLFAKKDEAAILQLRMQILEFLHQKVADCHRITTPREEGCLYSQRRRFCETDQFHGAAVTKLAPQWFVFAPHNMVLHIPEKFEVCKISICEPR